MKTEEQPEVHGFGDNWSASGTGVVSMTEYATVDMGDYYPLEAKATINGRTYTDSDGFLSFWP